MENLKSNETPSGDVCCVVMEKSQGIPTALRGRFRGCALAVGKNLSICVPSGAVKLSDSGLMSPYLPLILSRCTVKAHVSV